MKKIKKLLPRLFLVGTLANIIPFFASCSNDKNTHFTEPSESEKNKIPGIGETSAIYTINFIEDVQLSDLTVNIENESSKNEEKLKVDNISLSSKKCEISISWKEYPFELTTCSFTLLISSAKGWTKQINNCSLTFIPIDVTSISLKNNPEKTEYTAGESFSLKGIEVYANNQIGEQLVEVTDLCTFSINDGEKIIKKELTGKQETQEVKVNFGSLNASFEIKVNPKQVDHISIVSKPTTLYYQTGDTFNTDGLEVAAYNEDGEKIEDLSSEQITVSPENGSVFTDEDATGLKEVTVTLNEYGFSSKFSIYVSHKALVLDYLEVTKQPTKVNYFSGDKFSRSGLQVKLHYKDSEVVEDVSDVCTTNPAEGEKVEHKTSNVWETHDATISFGSLQANIPITVCASGYAGDHIRITNLPKKLCYTNGDKLDLTGLQVWAYESADETKIIGDVTHYSVTTPKSDERVWFDTKNVTVKYGGKHASFDIVVANEIKITKQPVKTEYIVGDTLDLSGLEVKAYDADGKELGDVTNMCETLPKNGEKIKENNIDSIQVTCGEMSKYINIKVNTPCNPTFDAVNDARNLVVYGYVTDERIVDSLLTSKLDTDAWQQPKWDANKNSLWFRVNKDGNVFRFITQTVKLSAEVKAKCTYDYQIELLFKHKCWGEFCWWPHEVDSRAQIQVFERNTLSDYPGFYNCYRSKDAKIEMDPKCIDRTSWEHKTTWGSLLESDEYKASYKICLSNNSDSPAIINKYIQISFMIASDRSSAPNSGNELYTFFSIK